MDAVKRSFIGTMLVIGLVGVYVLTRQHQQQEEWLGCRSACYDLGHYKHHRLADDLCVCNGSVVLHENLGVKWRLKGR